MVLQRYLLLLCIMVFANNAMDQNASSSEPAQSYDIIYLPSDIIRLSLPNKKLINVAYSSNTTIKMLKEFIHKNHHTNEHPLPIEQLALYPIIPHPKTPSCLMTSSAAITDNDQSVKNMALAHNTKFFKLVVLALATK